jgi:enoyl-[acyl-carrier protein] reductase I
MLLAGKKILVTGVLTDDSIAYSVARVSQEAGAEIVLTSFGRAMSITQRIARRLDPAPDVLEMDVNDGTQIAAVAADLEQRWGRLDGLLHAIGFAPQDAMGGGFLDTPWDSAAVAFQTSAYSLKALTAGMLPLLKVSGADGGASVVSLTFDARYAWPIYDWMGVAKAGLESITRYLARDLGPHHIRVNLVSAGPIRSMAGKNIPGFAQLTGRWGDRAPLGWDVNDSMPVGRMVCFLLSDWAPLTTGEMIHVDGGFHALGIGVAESEPDEPAG